MMNSQALISLTEAAYALSRHASKTQDVVVSVRRSSVIRCVRSGSTQVGFICDATGLVAPCYASTPEEAVMWALSVFVWQLEGDQTADRVIAYARATAFEHGLRLAERGRTKQEVERAIMTGVAQ